MASRKAGWNRSRIDVIGPPGSEHLHFKAAGISPAAFLFQRTLKYKASVTGYNQF